MARKRRNEPSTKVADMPADLWPDDDAWGSPAKAQRRSAWLEDHELSSEYFFRWVPAHLAERRRLAGLPPRGPARRKGRLPREVAALVAKLKAEGRP